MPLAIRCLVRGLQVLGRSKEDCGEFMFRALHEDAYKGGFHLLNEYGEATPKPTKLHEEAKAAVWAHMNKVAERLGSAA